MAEFAHELSLQATRENVIKTSRVFLIFFVVRFPGLSIGHIVHT